MCDGWWCNKHCYKIQLTDGSPIAVCASIRPSSVRILWLLGQGYAHLRHLSSRRVLNLLHLNR
eukprot:4693284-Amphidinium_carterae.1